MFNQIRKNRLIHAMERNSRRLLNIFIRIVLFFNYGRKRRLGDQEKYYVFLNGGIGDCIMALPAIHFMTKKCSEVYLAVPEHSRMFFDDYPNVQILSYSASDGTYRTLRKIVKFFGDSDGIYVSMNPRFESFLIFLLSGATSSFGFIKSRVSLDGIRLDTKTRSISGIGKTQRYVELAKHLLGLDEANVADVVRLQKLRFTTDPCLQDYIVCAPGKTSLWPAGRWDPTNFAASINAIALKYNKTVIFVGTKDEQNEIDAVIVKCNKNIPIKNMMCKTDLVQLIKIINGADLVLCNDSGIMHMASLMDTPTVSIFSFSDKNEFAWGRKNFPMQEKKMACQPCIPNKISMLGDNLAFSCPFDAVCDMTVDSRKVISKMEQILDE